MHTWNYRPNSVDRKWHVVDANDIILGRLATKVATILRGKHRPEYTLNADCGDHVVVINAEKIRVTGRKEEQKKYYRHSRYAGGLKTTSLKMMREKHPERIVEFAVKGMLPKNPLGRKMALKLKVYAGDQHPHAAQQPEALTID
ncbi:MAG: 50S ribosomal protein L13 [Mariprofundaceae bacterium]